VLAIAASVIELAMAAPPTFDNVSNRVMLIGYKVRVVMTAAKSIVRWASQI
jgi:hypothetical protein